MNFFRILFLLIVSLFSRVVCAADIFVTPPTGLLPHVGNAPENTIASVISYGIGLAGVLAVMAVTWAGVQMILAAGDEEKTKKARNIIIYAFIGVVVAGLAYGVVKFATNLQLDTFR